MSAQQPIAQVQLEADAARWAFFRDHAGTRFQGTRLYLWLFHLDTMGRFGGIEPALDWAMTKTREGT